VGCNSVSAWIMRLISSIFLSCGSLHSF